jgi:hypothetical protein
METTVWSVDLTEATQYWHSALRVTYCSIRKRDMGRSLFILSGHIWGLAVGTCGPSSMS